MAPGVSPVSTIASNTSLAIRPLMVLSASRSSNCPSDAAETGLSAMVRPVRFSAAKKSPIIQFAACLASRPRATASKKAAVSASATSTAAS